MCGLVGRGVCCALTHTHGDCLTRLIGWLMLSPVGVSLVSISVLVFLLGARISASYSAVCPLYSWPPLLISSIQDSIYCPLLHLSILSSDTEHLWNVKRFFFKKKALKHNRRIYSAKSQARSQSSSFPLFVIGCTVAKWAHPSCAIMMPYQKLKPHLIFIFKRKVSAQQSCPTSTRGVVVSKPLLC